MQVVFTRAARRDLVAIRSHIGSDNPAAAVRVAAALLAACERLDLMPERGRSGLVPGTRELTVVPPYVIVYRVGTSAVEILRIRHGAQRRDR